MVFCSFDPKDMRIKPTSPRDIKLVQKFLEFAKNPQGSASIGVSVSRSAHITHLAEKIKEMGYRVDTQVGMSGMRVDVSVARHDSKKWEMAVLLDGPDWADRGSAVQREILPKIMLKSLVINALMSIADAIATKTKVRILAFCAERTKFQLLARTPKCGITVP